MSENNKAYNIQGFTLVELAIVMLIIGFLIGAVLRGQEMIMNARVVATTQQIKGLEAAVWTFRDIYEALPGDFEFATERVPNCINTINTCSSGNGNGYILQGPVDTSGGANSNTSWKADESALNTEASQFWKHLMLMDLITGVGINPNNIAWGESHPTTPLGGGMHVKYVIDKALDEEGHTFRFQGNPSGAAGFIPPGQDPGNTAKTAHAITPKRIWQIDRKLDDGNPKAGIIQAIEARDNNGIGIGNSTFCVLNLGQGNGSNANFQYNIQSDDMSCVFFYFWS